MRIVPLNPILRAAAIAVVVAIQTASSPAEDLIIESRAEGRNFDRYSEPAGLWMNSQVPPSASKSSAPGLTAQGECGSRKILFQKEQETGASAAAAAARFSPRFSEPGKYFVYVTWPSGGNATPVEYAVKHARGTDTQAMPQDGYAANGGTGNANAWILLGDFDFAAGPDQYVELRIGPGCAPTAKGKAGQVFSDAVRFATSPLKEERASAASKPAPVEFKPAAAGPPLKWENSIQEAMTVAAGGAKRILVFFDTPGTDRSQQLGELFEDAEVKAVLARGYVPVRLDYARNREVAAKLGVVRGGTVLVYESSGDAVFQIDETPARQELLKRLK